MEQELKSVSKFAKDCNVSRQNIYQLIESKSLDAKKIDDFVFVVLNQKAINYKNRAKKLQ